MSAPAATGEADGRTGGAAPNDSAIGALSVDALIERFGGIRPMAAKLDVPVTTVQGWKERAAIPERRWPEIAAAAQQHGIRLTSEAGTVTMAPASQSMGGRSADSAPPAGSNDSPPRRRRSRRAYWIGGALAAVVVAVLFGGPAVKERWSSFQSRHTASPGQVEDNRSTTAAGESNEATSRQSTSSTAASGDTDTALAERIATLEARLAASDNTTVAALKSENRRLSEELDQLRARLAVMEQDRASRREERERAQALFMALGQLRAALAGAAPYAVQLELIESALGKDAKVTAILAALRPTADRGVPTRAMLGQRFDTITADIMRATQPKSEAWQGRIAQQIASLIVVRRIGSNAPDGGAEAILARTESALFAGDLATAVATIEHLSGPALDAAEPWLADARARLAADRALLALEARTFAVLIGLDGAKAP